MRPYHHFALQNLFLSSGFKVTSSQYGELISYSDEAGLENCVRLILASTPKRLTGRELRFLRRGLGISQSAFGDLIDRDAQTVARIEKSDERVSRPVDLTIRTAFFRRFRPSESVDHISSLVDETAKVCAERIVLSYQETCGWTYRYDVPRLVIRYSDQSDFECDTRVYAVKKPLHRRLVINESDTTDDSTAEKPYANVIEDEFSAGTDKYHILTLDK